MRIIDTGITKEILSGDNHPQLKIVDKLYTVDNRQSTWDKIQKVQEDKKLSDDVKSDKVFELALGLEALNEIKNMDLPVENYVYLTYCIMGAITGEEPTKLLEMAKKQKN